MKTNYKIATVSLIAVLLLIASCALTTKKPETVRDLMETEGWEYCQLIEADFVYNWAGVTYIGSKSLYDLFKKGQDYAVTPPLSDELNLESYSHVDGYENIDYWIRYRALAGNYTVRAKRSGEESSNYVTLHYNGRTLADPHNNGAIHYFNMGNNAVIDRNNDNYQIKEGDSPSEWEPADVEAEDEPAKKYKQCPACYGTSRCGACGGTGSVYNSIDYSPGQWVDCSSCGGSGSCGLCDGTGVVEDFGW